jgi:hypothetical protein
MKYQVVYTKNKKKATSKQIATFYKVEDACMWEKHVKEQGCFDVEVVPVF